jgi:hypothetical protein
LNPTKNLNCVGGKAFYATMMVEFQHCVYYNSYRTNKQVENEIGRLEIIEKLYG